MTFLKLRIGFSLGAGIALLKLNTPPFAPDAFAGPPQFAKVTSLNDTSVRAVSVATVGSLNCQNLLGETLGLKIVFNAPAPCTLILSILAFARLVITTVGLEFSRKVPSPILIIKLSPSTKTGSAVSLEAP
jgi:hypothetical protein